MKHPSDSLHRDSNSGGSDLWSNTLQVRPLQWFHTELVYIVSRIQQTVMFVNMLRVYKRPNFSLSLEKNFDTRLIRRISIYMVHIGRIYLVIRTQNKAEVSIWGAKIFYIQVSFGPQKISGVKVVIICKSPMNHTRTCCLLRAVVSNGMFYVLPLFVRSLHVAAFLWTWHICHIWKEN